MLDYMSFRRQRPKARVRLLSAPKNALERLGVPESPRNRPAVIPRWQGWMPRRYGSRARHTIPRMSPLYWHMEGRAMLNRSPLARLSLVRGR